MFVPYKTDATITKLPASNIIMMFFNIIMFLAIFIEVGSFDTFVLDGFNFSLITHAFMHGDFWHLLGNMFYLWIFGNAICSNVGSASYPAIFLSLAIISGTSHLIFDGSPAIGASGAINGIIGIYLYLHPRTNVHCMWTITWLWGEKFTIKAYLLIGFWFLFDIIALIYSDNNNIGYVSHISGLVAGFIVGWLLNKYNWVQKNFY